ncbi:MAG: PQQ-binding-like beta-propeller repeat protein [Pirellulales bacterium]
MTRVVSLLLPILGFSLASQAGDSWPQFRGPAGQGHSGAANLPFKWSESENIRWKIALPGQGHSSPVVMGDQIWVTTAVHEAGSDDELARKTADLSGGTEFRLARNLSLRALCVDRRSGSVLRDIEVFSVAEPDQVHAINSYASPTPVLEPGRVYVHFGTYGTACLDTDSGDILWKRTFPLQHNVGPGSSPVVVGDALIIPCDGADRQFVVAVDKATGETMWERDRPPSRAKNGDFKKSFSTPLVVDWQGQTQVVIPGSQWIVAYDPATGNAIWQVDHGDGFSVVPRPVASESHLFFSTGFSRPEVVALKLGGTGDVTATHVDWRLARQAPSMASPLLVANRLYTVSDGGVAVCLDAATNQVHWQERLGGNYSASPLLADDRIYFFNREGLSTVLTDNGDKPEVVAENELDGAIFATPAALDGELLLRTESHLYAIGE